MGVNVLTCMGVRARDELLLTAPALRKEVGASDVPAASHAASEVPAASHAAGKADEVVP